MSGVYVLHGANDERQDQGRGAMLLLLADSLVFPVTILYILSIHTGLVLIRRKRSIG